MQHLQDKRIQETPIPDCDLHLILHLTHEPLSHPRVNTKTFGERSFFYAGPSVWNNLPQTLCHSDSASSFKAALKTHLFNNYF